MAMKKLPPAEKAYEAYSAIADGRAEMHEASGDGGTASGYALVDSSDRTKTYEVAWKGDTYSSTDNGTYWQGYAGYPVIAVLVLQGRLPQPPADTLADLAGVPWKQLNDAHKRDYAAAVSEVLAEAPDQDRADIERSCRQVLEALSTLDLTLTRKRTL